MQSEKNTRAQQFIQLVTNRFKLRLFMLARLPMAYVAGLRVKAISEEQAEVTIPYKYLNKNPFRSVYFASLSMAAELSTGLLCLMHTYKADPVVSMLVTGLQADFTKKATGLITFRCTDGQRIKEAASQAKTTGKAVTITATSTGTDETGEQVAEFRFTWAMKAKTNTPA